MAGKRFSDPTSADETTTINNVKITDSEYTSDETKKTVSNQKTAETEKMMNSASTTSVPENDTSPVTGCIDDIPPDPNSQKIEEDLKKAEGDKLKYAIKNNPDYFEEMGLNPDELLFSTTFFGDTGGTTSYYEEDETNLSTIIDENGFSYIETQVSGGQQQTTTGTMTQGQVVDGTPPILKVSGEFAHPTNNKGHTSSPLGLRILPQKNSEDQYWQFHSGIDIGMGGTKNVPTYAIYGGIISRVNTDRSGGGYGNFVELSFLFKGKKFTAFYAHLDKVFVKVNDTVVKGQPLATVGGTGKIPEFAIHLHFEIKDPSGKVWSDFRGNIFNTYNNRTAKKISGGSLGWINGSNQEQFAIKSGFKKYLDPAKFLNTPSDFV